ncbi:hypothetical protein BDW75DRAFT_208777 [Aspergillus navahoensis]
MCEREPNKNAVYRVGSDSDIRNHDFVFALDGQGVRPGQRHDRPGRVSTAREHQESKRTKLLRGPDKLWLILRLGADQDSLHQSLRCILLDTKDGLIQANHTGNLPDYRSSDKYPSSSGQASGEKQLKSRPVNETARYESGPAVKSTNCTIRAKTAIMEAINLTRHRWKVG